MPKSSSFPDWRTTATRCVGAMLYRGDNSGSRSSSKTSTRSRAGVRSVKRPHMPQFYRAAGGHSDAPGRRDRRWVCLGPEAFKLGHGGSCRIHFTVNRCVFPLSAFVISKKDSAARAMCARHFLRWLLMSSPSVGFFRAVAKDLLPEKSRPEAGLRTVIVGGRRSEGGRLWPAKRWVAGCNDREAATQAVGSTVHN